MYVRKIMDEFYKNSPDGLIGNEDCGQMSAWYVMSASGFYPVTPGSPIYAFGTPLFPEMTYRLENGKTFTIRAKNVSATNKYILNAKFNGVPYKKTFITHEDIIKGGGLEFTMIDAPVTTAFTEFPVSSMNIQSLPVPAIRFGAETGEGREVYFDRINLMDVIFYSTDGSDPFNSKTGIVDMGVSVLKTPTTLRVVSYDPDRKIHSKIVEASYHKKPNDWTVKIASKYSTQYAGNGDDGLIDGLRGTVNFASGEWQGYQGKTFEAVIDLQRETEIRTVGGSFLQAASSWIWMPERIEFESSTDGQDFIKFVEIKPNFPRQQMERVTREFLALATVNDSVPVRARYVRVKAYNFGKIPAWHPGAGGDPWIFVDEIFIR